MTTNLWCEKYRPKSFDRFKFHHNIAERLKLLVKEENFPHVFLYGPSGAGKRTIVRALLNEIYGAASFKLKIEQKTFEAPSGKKIKQTFLSSNFHLEVNPSENGYYDRVVIQELIKNMATNLSVVKKYSFRIVIIEDADSLTKEAQQALRRTMEKYAETCRIILMAEHSSRIIPALRSRCLMVRCPAPSSEELKNVLNKIIKIEKVDLNDSIIDKIIEESDHNAARAILAVQTLSIENELKSNGGKNIESTEIFRWQQKINQISKKLTTTQSVKLIAELRPILYDLLAHQISPSLILKTLLCQLINYCLDDEMKSNLIRIAAQIDHRIAQGSKSIIHLELFCIKFMMIFRCTVEKVVFDLEQPMDLD